MVCEFVSVCVWYHDVGDLVGGYYIRVSVIVVSTAVPFIAQQQTTTLSISSVALFSFSGTVFGTHAVTIPSSFIHNNFVRSHICGVGSCKRLHTRGDDPASPLQHCQRG